MTKAELLRKLQVGQKVKLTASKFGQDRIGKERKIVKLQTNGLYISKFGEENNFAGESWLDLPPASLIEANDKGFTFYEPALRELTTEEKQIMANQPSR